MKRMALILWLALCAGAGAAWVDPNTNASWGVLPVQAYTNGSLASPANFFSANRHAINNMFSNRGAVVNGYVPRFAYASTDINEWSVISEDPSVYELMGSALRIYNASFTGPTTGTIILPSTNAYIEINTAYDAAIGFADIEIDYQADAPIRTIADEYEPATSAPFGDHINRLYIRPTTTALVTGIRIYGFETNTFIGLTNDFAGISLRIDDPTAGMNPVNLRTATRLLDAETASIMSNTHPALWSSHPAQTITLSNGFSLSSRTNLDLLAGGVAALSVRSNRSVSVPSTLEVGTLSIGGASWTNLSEIRPSDYSNALARLSSVEGLYAGHTNLPGVALLDGSRAFDTLYVGGTNGESEQLSYQAYHTVINTGSCNFAWDYLSPKLPGSTSSATGSLCALDPITLWSHAYDMAEGADVPGNSAGINPPSFFSLQTFFYQNGRFVLNPNLAGSIALTTTRYVMVSDVTSSCTTNGATIHHSATSSIVLAIGVVQTGRLYRVAFDASTIGASPASMIVSFGGGTCTAQSGRVFSRYFFAESTNSLSIQASTADSAIEIDNLRIRLVAPGQSMFLAGDLVLAGSVRSYGSFSAGSLAEAGVPLSDSYVPRPVFNSTNAGMQAQINLKLSASSIGNLSNSVASISNSLIAASNTLRTALIQTSNSIHTAVNALSNTLSTALTNASANLYDAIAITSNAFVYSLATFDLSAYERKQDVSPSNLVSAWDFNEGYGSMVHDSYTNAAHLSGANASFWFTNAASNYRRNFAVFSSGVGYFGADGSKSASLMGGDQFTLSAWLCLTNASDGIEVLIWGPKSGDIHTDTPNFDLNSSWGLSQQGTNIFAHVGNSGYLYAAPPGWHYYALRYDGFSGSMALYRDDNLVTTQAVSALWWGQPTNVFSIGGAAWDQSKTAKAFIDDVLFFNRALSSNEIQSLRTKQSYGESGLHWHYQ